MLEDMSLSGRMWLSSLPDWKLVTKIFINEEKWLLKKRFPLNRLEKNQKATFLRQ